LLGEKGALLKCFGEPFLLERGKKGAQRHKEREEKRILGEALFRIGGVGTCYPDLPEDLFSNDGRNQLFKQNPPLNREAIF